MDYNKVNKIDVDGNGNIVLQDISGSTVTINYNDTAQFNKLLSAANEQILTTIKEFLTDFFAAKKAKEVAENKRYTPESVKQLAKDALSFGKQRKLEILSKNLDGYYRMLEDFEKRKMLSDSTREIMRCEVDIDKTNTEINRISAEIEKLLL